jgi:hypothetical protein
MPWPTTAMPDRLRALAIKGNLATRNLFWAQVG